MAEQADDPLLVAAGAFRLSVAFLGSGRHAHAERAAGSAAAALADRGGDRPEALALRGALTLQRAVAAARLEDADAAYEHLRAARELAERVGEGRNDFNTEFGPANAALHEVAVAADLGDAGHALRTAAAIDPDGLSPERRARFHLDVARAHAQRRQIAESTDALEAACRVAPELVRSMPRAGRLAGDLLAMSGSGATARLRALAAELGATPVP